VSSSLDKDILGYMIDIIGCMKREKIRIVTYEHNRVKENKEGPLKEPSKRAVDFVGLKKCQRMHTHHLAVHTCVHGLMEHEEEVGLISGTQRRRRTHGRHAEMNEVI
jgi:hypothetical protein